MGRKFNVYAKDFLVVIKLLKRLLLFYKVTGEDEHQDLLVDTICEAKEETECILKEMQVELDEFICNIEKTTISKTIKDSFDVQGIGKELHSKMVSFDADDLGKWQEVTLKTFLMPFLLNSGFSKVHSEFPMMKSNGGGYGWADLLLVKDNDVSHDLCVVELKYLSMNYFDKFNYSKWNNESDPRKKRLYGDQTLNEFNKIKDWRSCKFRPNYETPKSKMEDAFKQVLTYSIPHTQPYYSQTQVSCYLIIVGCINKIWLRLWIWNQDIQCYELFNEYCP